MKRKRMIKLLMSYGVPRNKAVFYAGLCGGEASHYLVAACALGQPDVYEMLWDIWVKFGRPPGLLGVRLKIHGEA